MLLDVGFTSCISLLLKHAGASLSGDALVAKKNYIYIKKKTLCIYGRFLISLISAFDEECVHFIH